VTVTDPPQGALSRTARDYLTVLLGPSASAWQMADIRAALESYAAARRRTSRHIATLELVGGGRVLDLGCDIGVLARDISFRATSILGVDMRPEAIEIARQFFEAPNIEYRACDFSQLDPGEVAFDGVIFLETIEHVDDPARVLASIHKRLRPGGTLVLSTPNALSYHETLRQLARLWPSFRSDRGIRQLAAQIAAEVPGSGTQDDHLYSWTWETLYRLTHRTGFRYVDHRRAGFAAASLPIGSRRFWPLGRRELPFLESLVGPFCQTLILKLEAVKT
jgi:2-polyprenyl-3-methyl-5-hydroxy-6-metoxy-1,4-benzoquinol methylase